MTTQKKLAKPPDIHLLENPEEIKTPENEIAPNITEEDRDVIPGKEPFEKPPFEIPSPGEGP